MVAGDDEDVGRERADLRQQRVEALERRDLGVEVAVLARLVGVLVVQEEEVVGAPSARGAWRPPRRRSRRSSAPPCRPAGPARGTSDRRRWRRRGARTPRGSAAARAAGRSRAAGPCWRAPRRRGGARASRDERVDEVGRRARPPARARDGRGAACPSGCGSVSESRPREAGPAQHEHEAVLLHRLDEDLDARQRGSPAAARRAARRPRS